MAQADDEQQQALLRCAQDRLHAGASPEAVFTELAELGESAELAELAVNAGHVPAVAIAVCVAAGTSRAEAEKRWAADGELLLTDVRDGDEASFGKFLEMIGFFDFHRPLDEREQQISRLLGQAFTAHGGWPSGLGFRLVRWLQTGRFVDALTSMADRPPRPDTSSPSTYWTQLLAAANMLVSSDDDRAESVVVLCRQRLGQSSASGTDSSG